MSMLTMKYRLKVVRSPNLKTLSTRKGPSDHALPAAFKREHFEAQFAS